MNKKLIIEQTKKFVRKKSENDTTGHDWWHTYRVWKTAIAIGEKEKADIFIIELTALLHDVDDWKFNARDGSDGQKTVRKWLEKIEVKENIISHVCEIIKNMSFKGLEVKSKLETIEGRVVQDADRLDAIGAVGMARVFAYHSNTQKLIYDPEISLNKRVNDLRKQDSYSSVHHFYDKLFHVKKLMNTSTGKQIAEGRHEFIKVYLKQFFNEWYGKK